MARPAFGAQPTTSGPRRFTGSLPHWVLADNETAGEANGEGSVDETALEATETGAPVAEEHHEEASGEPLRNETAGLSDEELTALSARLVEAKHEEVQARADADTLAGGAEFDEEETEEEESVPEEHHGEEVEDLHEEALEELPVEEARFARVRQPARVGRTRAERAFGSRGIARR